MNVDAIKELLICAYGEYAVGARKIWPGRFNEGPRSNHGSQERYLAAFLWEQFQKAGFDLCPEMPLNFDDIKKKADLFAAKSGDAGGLVWIEIKQAYNRSSTRSWLDEMRDDMARINGADPSPRGWHAGAGIAPAVFGVVIGIAVEGLVVPNQGKKEFAEMADKAAAGRAVQTAWLDTSPCPAVPGGKPQPRWVFHALWQLSP